MCVQKTLRQLLVGLLELLPIPQQPWSHLSVDFPTELPNSQGHMTINVINDWFSKACRWPIPLKDRFPSNISPLQWRWRRLSIIKSSGSTAFQRTPSRIMPLSSHLDYGDTTSSYHSQFNGQVERLYQEISLHLQSYCSCDQHRWSEFLPCTEYALIGAFPHWSHTLQMCFRIPTSFVSMVRQALRHPSMIGSVKAGACSTVCWCNSRELYNINKTRLIDWDAPT